MDVTFGALLCLSRKLRSFSGGSEDHCECPGPKGSDGLTWAQVPCWSIADTVFVLCGDLSLTLYIVSGACQPDDRLILKIAAQYIKLTRLPKKDRLNVLNVLAWRGNRSHHTGYFAHHKSLPTPI
jgi:hypothetical protein